MQINMAVNHTLMLNLYRNLIRESKKWSSYNFREYALRKVRHEFRQNSSLADNTAIECAYKKGLESLEIIKRQVQIGKLYSARPLVIEAQRR